MLGELGELAAEHVACISKLLLPDGSTTYTTPKQVSPRFNRSWREEIASEALISLHMALKPTSQQTNPGQHLKVKLVDARRELGAACEKAGGAGSPRNCRQVGYRLCVLEVLGLEPEHVPAVIRCLDNETEFLAKKAVQKKKEKKPRRKVSRKGAFGTAPRNGPGAANRTERLTVGKQAKRVLLSCRESFSEAHVALAIRRLGRDYQTFMKDRHHEQDVLITHENLPGQVAAHHFVQSRCRLLAVLGQGFGSQLLPHFDVIAEWVGQTAEVRIRHLFSP